MTGEGAAPFASSDDLQEGWRPLSSAEHVSANRLLAAASAIIRRQRPELSADDDDAKTVVLDVVRGALGPGAERGLSTFAKTVGPRSKSGVATNPDGELRWARWHCQLLNISFEAMPLGSFGDCDRGTRGHFR